MFKRLKKKGYISLELIIIAGVLLTAAGVSIPVIMDDIGDSAMNVVEIKDKIPDSSADEETGYIIQNGQSIHYNETPGIIEVPDEPIEVDPDDGVIHVSSITMSTTTLNMYLGESTTVTATVSPSNAANKQIAWTTSNREVATVSANGKITAVGVGAADIYATAYDNGVRGVVHVIVKEIPSTDIKLNYTSLTLREGEEVQLEAEVIPSDTTNKEIVFSSEDPTIATVSSDGKVVAMTAVKGKNTTNIIVSNGSVRKIVPVEVIADRVYTESIKVDTSIINMFVGNTKKINASVVPSNASDTTLKYEIIDTDIATVDDNGNITAKKEGSTALYIRNYGADFYGKEVYAVVLINVQKQKVNAESMTLRYPNSHMYPGDTQTPIYEIFPEDTSDKSLTWTSSNPNAVSVDTNGKITAISQGTSTIKAVSNDNPSVSDTFTVTVDAPIISVEEIVVDPTFVILEVGKSAALDVKVYPENATVKDIEWTVTDQTVVAVDKNTSSIIGLRSGRTQVRLESVENPNVYMVITVLVEDTPIESIEISPNEPVLNKGENVQMIVEFTPSAITNDSIKWTSSNTSVGTIDENGLFTAKDYGTTLITAEAVNGVADTTVITVKEITPTSIEFDQTDYTMQANECELFNVLILPDNAVNKEYDIIVENPQIASVDIGKKQICGVSVGNTTITAVSKKDPNVKTSVSVSVTPIYVEDLILQPSSATLNLDKNETYTIQYTVYPYDAEIPEVSFISQDNLVATVDENGTITPVGVGETDIYLSVDSENNIDADKMPYVFHVSVISEIVEPTDLIADEPLVSIVLDNPVQTYKLKYHFEPEDATQTALKWESDNELIAIVDQNGVVTPIGLGDCKITATTTNAAIPLEITFDVNVRTPQVETFTVSPGKMILTLDDPTQSYTVSIEPTSAPQTYNLSYDENFVEVDKVNQTITAKQTGKTTVYFYDYEYNNSFAMEIDITSNSWDGSSDGDSLEIVNGVCYVRQPSELAYLSEQSQSEYLSQTCTQVEIMNDIRLDGGIFKPFNLVDVPINGNGFTISNLSVNESGEATFIKNLSGSLSDITIDNSTFVGSSASLVASTFSGSLENVHLTNNTLSVENTGNLLVGNATLGLLKNIEIVGNHVYTKDSYLNSTNKNVVSSNESVIDYMGAATIDGLYVEQENAGSLIRTTNSNSGVVNHTGFTTYYKDVKIVQNAVYPVSVKNSYFINAEDFSSMSNPVNVHFGKENSTGNVYTETIKYNANGNITTSNNPAYTLHANHEMKNSQDFVDLINEQEGALSWYLNYNKYPNIVALADRLVDIDLLNDSIELSVDTNYSYIPEFNPIPDGFAPESYACVANSDDSIATVSSSCDIKTVDVGETYFSIDFGDGIFKTVNLKVTEKNYPISIDIIEDSVSIMTGESYDLNYEIIPEDANYAFIEWESSDETVAVVGVDGSIVGLNVGETTITATTVDEDGNVLTDSCKVTVENEYPINYILNGGTLTETAPVSYSGKYDVSLPIPIKEDYAFVGWRDIDGKFVETIPAGSSGEKTFEAIWEEYYDINYELNGGEFTTGYPKRYASSQGLANLPVPEKEKHKFVGWAVEKEMDDYSMDSGFLKSNYFTESGYNVTYFTDDAYEIVADQENEKVTGPAIAGMVQEADIVSELAFSLQASGNISFNWFFSGQKDSRYQLTYELYKEGSLVKTETISGSETDRYNGGLSGGSLNTEKMNNFISLEKGDYIIKFIFHDYYFEEANGYISDLIIKENSVITEIPVGTTGDIVLSAQWIEEETTPPVLTLNTSILSIRADNTEIDWNSFISEAYDDVSGNLMDEVQIIFPEGFKYENSRYPVGRYEIKYLVEDGAGNVSEATLIVDISAPLPPVTTYAFTIDGTRYKTERNMTWYQWVNSDYNDGQFIIGPSGYVVLRSSPTTSVRYDGALQFYNTTIIAGANYTLN